MARPNPPGNIRRHDPDLPSARTHGLIIFLILAILGLGAYIYYSWNIRRAGDDRPSFREVLLPVGAGADQIESGGALPDLLAGEADPGTNPTVSEVKRPNPPPAGDNNIGPGSAAAPGTGLSLSGVPSDRLAGDETGEDIKINGAAKTPRRNAASHTPLVRAPVEGIDRMSPFGRVPYPSSDGRKALSVYAKPFTPTLGKKYVAIVVGGLGINGGETRRAISALPETVTLAFAAEAPQLQGWINQARANGHEVMIELPMKDKAVGDTVSAYTLAPANQAAVNIRNLDYLMSRAQGYFAVTNYGGARLIPNQNSVRPILAHLANAGLGFIYDGALRGSNILALAGAEKLPAQEGKVILDEKAQSARAVRTALATLQALAGDPGAAPIGMGFAYPGTIDGIASWAKNRPKQIEIVPVSYLLQAR